MRPLIVDQDLKDKIANLVSYADRNPLSMDDLLDIYNKQMKPTGDIGPYTLILPFGYKIVYTIDAYPDKKIRHLSMSVDTPGSLPNPAMVQEIMKLIGFKGGLLECIVHLEDIAINHQAINVMEAIK